MIKETIFSAVILVTVGVAFSIYNGVAGAATALENAGGPALTAPVETSFWAGILNSL